eukprot:CAMPEP_0116886348 /NCGR_PEP_ID=MMETSP0463-20121206/20160_1 /TAXON_ID=181622 /ORGANISM="Strombidinopsis sp, Strain SopsisLIS2011" /LENGTH=175 /DNA_ID=CAMNT_0004546603 /DNA_START=128 /DNA_END=655 /DNA_ORIENTATION=-
MGTFLSLTGKSIHGVDAKKLNLSEGIVHKPNDYEYHVGDVIYSQEVYQNGAATLFNGKEQIITPWDINATNRSESFNKGNQADQNRLDNSKKTTNIVNRFLEAKERVPSSIGEAEYQYMQMLRKDVANREEHDQTGGYLEYKERLAVNYLQKQIDYLKMHCENPAKDDYTIAVQH